MPRGLRDDLADAWRADVLASFGEAAEFRPEGGTPREILAVVDRGGAEDIGGPDRAKGLGFRVHVANHATAGVTPDELVPGRDAIVLAENVGGELVERRISKIVSQSAVKLVFELV